MKTSRVIVCVLLALGGLALMLLVASGSMIAQAQAPATGARPTNRVGQRPQPPQDRSSQPARPNQIFTPESPSELAYVMGLSQQDIVDGSFNGSDINGIGIGTRTGIGTGIGISTRTGIGTGTGTGILT